MEIFPFNFLLQVLDEIGVDVASQVGISSYSFVDFVVIWYNVFVTKLNWVILELFGSCQQLQKEELHRKKLRTLAGI